MFRFFRQLRRALMALAGAEAKVLEAQNLDSFFSISFPTRS
jgi:hypothetical protein